ncbi:hypothetical protein D1B31_17985 [Neobacillus notoginsengisoli]|uniref:Uncharacterized protein n=1 Tax=Neobacillus notoginsengisoli TaxID=1578198 RepID=A0A417YQ27_9BACI|nr:hypothetical protein [Neobacillus notoginsengisoli]RHW35979.1 hypothetical protein D1B31_17985 [Neobacillus notoginsengisoli]
MTKAIEQTDIFSMFDIEDEHAIKMEAAKAAAIKQHEQRIAELKEAKDKNDTTPAAAPKKEPFKVLVDTIVRYAGMDLPVTDYFTVEEIENGLPVKKKKSDENSGDEIEFKPITENDLRKKLEQDFAELVANFTQLVYIEKKNIIAPILSAKKKGMVDCLETSANAGVSVSSKKKIPFSILADFIVVAKGFSNSFGTEVHADIYFDLDKQEFFMDFPKQVVSPLLCSVDENIAWINAEKFGDRRYIKIMEIHSHHVMPTKPSSTDDLNERAPILYAIVGRLDKFFPDIIVRTFNKNAEKHVYINPNKIFECPPIFESYATYLHDISEVEVQ